MSFQILSRSKRLYLFVFTLIFTLGLNLAGCGSSGSSYYPPYHDPLDPGMGDVDGNGAIVCGDGVIEGYEKCDDQNDLSDDGCMSCLVASNWLCTGQPSVCHKIVCGDGVIEGYEKCDDGNEVYSDGCNGDCKIQTGYFCNGQPSVCAPNPENCGNGIKDSGEECDTALVTENNFGVVVPCMPGCKLPVCGDGHVAQVQGESCDDGNLNGGDGCSPYCGVEQNYQCVGQPSVCAVLTFCGDGIQDTGEECDDGNFINTDNCTSYCKAALCGDGFVGNGEQCDDANKSETDACHNDCQLASCGDGVLQVGVEICDDGNLNDNDNCPSNCKPASCGDGFVGPGEQCDDGNTKNYDLCLNNCQNAKCGDGIRRTQGANPEQCDDGNNVDTDSCRNNCANSFCGDGILWGSAEVCDDGNLNPNDGCTNYCKPARCGDGVVQNGVEFCDDGNSNDHDACRNNCVVSVCGDGIVQSTEVCDDGNQVNADGCTGCQKDADYACGGEPSVCMQIPGNNCGDGNVDILAGEQCDDGNSNDHDACVNCKTAFCGDGYVRAGVEFCDDGNVSNDDACKNNCQLAVCGDNIVAVGLEDCEDGNNDSTDACVNCKFARCGDGATHVGFEECDDGNTFYTDTCLNGCKAAKCGDGITSAGNGEQCDDGNLINTDGCRNDCNLASCGDSIIQGSEKCDDGNFVSTDACVSCKIAECGDGYVQAGVEECDYGFGSSLGGGCSLNCLKDDLAFSKSILFAKRIGGLNDPLGATSQYNSKVIATDFQNNVLFSGQFQYGIDFGNNISLSSQNTSPFLVKFDSNGNAIWADIAWGANALSWFAVDPQNAFLMFTSLGDHLRKFDSNGTLEWSKSLDCDPPISIDTTGSIWFESYRIEFGYNNAHNADYQKIGSDGAELLNLQSLYPYYSDQGRFLSTKEGETYFLRSFKGTFTDFSSNVPFLSSGEHDLFITKLGVHGELLWQRSYGSVNNEVLYAADVAENGDLFVVVYAEPQTDLFGVPVNDPDQIIVARLDAKTGTPRWSTALGQQLWGIPLGSPKDNFFEVQPVTGHLILYISNGGLLKIDAESGQVLAQNLQISSYWKKLAIRASGIWLYDSNETIVKLDQNLKVVWVRRIPDALQNSAIAIDMTGNTYLTGNFLGTLDLGNGNILTNPSGFELDIALIKLAP